MPIHDWTRVQAGIFHHFHHEWISTISQALNSGILPPEYYALAEQVAGGLGPDVLTLEAPRTVRDEAEDDLAQDTGGGGVISLTKAPPKVRFTASEDSEAYAFKQKSVVIRHVTDHEVIAVVEIVSPGNKASQRALRLFVEKSIEFLDAGIHLLIIDLFSPGPRDPGGIHDAIWSDINEEHEFDLPDDQPLTLVSYSAGPPKQAFIEPVSVGAALPEMPLFLRPRRYVPVPLNDTYEAAFNAVPPYWRAKLM